MRAISKIKNYLIYGFFFLLPWSTRWIIVDSQINGQTWEYGRLSLYAFDVVFLFCLFLHLITPATNFFATAIKSWSKLSLKNKLGWGLVVLLIILNIVWAANYWLAIYWWCRVGEAWLIFMWLKKMVWPAQWRAGLSLLVSLTLAAVLGLYQFFTQHVFACKWLGLAFQNPKTNGVSVLATANGWRILRLYGSLPHPNMMAGFLLVALLMLAWLLKKPLAKKRLFLVYGATIVLSSALFLTFSRSAWLAAGLLIIGYNIYYIYISKKNKQNFQSAANFFWPVWKTMSWVVAGVLIVSTIIYWPLVSGRLGLDVRATRLETQSIQQRIAGFQESQQLIFHYPLGLGLGNYTLGLQSLVRAKEAYYYQPVHNVLLLALSELGFPWLIFIVLFLLSRLKKIGLALSNLSQQPLQIMLSLVFLVMFLTDHFWWSNASGLIILINIFLCLRYFTHNPGAFEC